VELGFGNSKFGQIKAAAMKFIRCVRGCPKLAKIKR